jgi:hypothetical protein
VAIMPTAAVARPWRKYMRISVRGLVVAVLVLGGGFGWVVNRARVQREAVAAIERGFETPVLPFATVLRIHSFAARTFGAKPRPLVISNTQKASARRSANGGCLTSPHRTTRVGRRQGRQPRGAR